MSDALPTQFTVGNRTYKLIPFCQSDDDTGYTSYPFVDIAGDGVGASTSKEDGEYIRSHSSEIDPRLRGRIYMIFMNWTSPSDSQSVVFLSLNSNGTCSIISMWTPAEWSMSYHHFFVRRIR